MQKDRLGQELPPHQQLANRPAPRGRRGALRKIAFVGRLVRLYGGQAPVIGPGEGEIDAPLAADWPNRPRQIVDALDVVSLDHS